MTNLPANLPTLLRDAGLTVVTVGDWLANMRPGPFGPVGVLNHHTGSFDAIGDTKDDLSYATWLFRTGRADLPAPLCGLSISAEGVVYLGAAGRANHAGTAKPAGSVSGGDGNTLYVGIEWMLSGKQPISSKQYEAGATTNAVLLRVLGSSVQTVQCHYSTSITGKWDIGDPDGVLLNGQRVLDLPKFRRAVSAELTRLEPAKPKPKPKPTKVTEARDRIIIALRRAELAGKRARAKSLRAALRLLPKR